MEFTQGIMIFVFLFIAAGLGMVWAVRSSRDSRERIKKMLPFIIVDVLLSMGLVLFVLQNS